MNVADLDTPSVGESAGPAQPVRPQEPPRRNGALLVGLGCVGLLVLVPLVLSLIAGAALLMGIRSSDAYQVALATAQHDSSVVAALGAPVEPGWLTLGHIEVNGPVGKADLSIPIAGPRGSGTLYVGADKAAGKWTFRTLRVDISGRAAPVDLLPAVAPSSGAP